MRVTRQGMLILVLSFVCSIVNTAEAKSLKIASFNIKWFGLGGRMDGSPQREKRDPQIKAFLKETKLDQFDVIVFEEIVNPKRLHEKVLEKKMDCHSYDHSDDNHQHVVICHKKSYEFVMEEDDDNYALESVMLGRRQSRPAVHGVLKNNDGEPLVRILGVHLKAFPNESATRLKQAKEISKHLNSREDGLPVIITGDFNTYEGSGNTHDDVVKISRIFEKNDLQFVENRDQYTYRNKYQAGTFDHFWVSSEIAGPEAHSYSACQRYDNQNEYFKNTDYYNQHVSDHCPVFLTLNI